MPVYGLKSRTSWKLVDISATLVEPRFDLDSGLQTRMSVESAKSLSRFLLGHSSMGITFCYAPPTHTCTHTSFYSRLMNSAAICDTHASFVSPKILVSPSLTVLSRPLLSPFPFTTTVLSILLNPFTSCFGCIWRGLQASIIWLAPTIYRKHTPDLS